MALRHPGGAAVVSLMKIGLMGGSFDPIHFGHLVAAQDAMEGFQLDRLYLVPAAQAPLKPQAVQSTAADRLAMLRAAIEPGSRMEISDYELTKGGLSYTIDTVRHFRTLFPADDLFWVIGADQLRRLHEWKEIGDLARLTGFVCLERPGYSVATPAGIPDLNLRRGRGHLIEISSSELRDRVKAGLSLEYLCPQKVIAYIREKGLYR